MRGIGRAPHVRDSREVSAHVKGQSTGFVVFMCREISMLKFATCCQVCSNGYQPKLDWKELHLSSRCESEVSAMELGGNRPCLRNGERESEEREGAGIPPSARTLEMSLLSQHNDICLAGEIILLLSRLEGTWMWAREQASSHLRDNLDI